MPDAGTVADLGEFGLIAAVTSRLAPHDALLLGPGDDAAVVAAPDGRVVATTDVLVDGVHFRRAWSGPHDVGRRAAAASLADVAAMGAVPTALLVALVAPPDWPVADALALADGLAEEAALAGAGVAGGDVARGDVLTVAVTALGTLEGRTPVTRAGARAGDVVVVAGRLGWAAAGLAVLGRGFRSPRALVDAHRRPQPPYAAGPALAAAGATALVDVSDGLLQDLGHIAAASGVAIDVRRDAIEVARPLAEVGAALGADPWDWVLGGGDDHALAATLPAGVAPPEGCVAIGSVRAAAGEAGAVTVDGAAWAGAVGHRHFAG